MKNKSVEAASENEEPQKSKLREAIDFFTPIVIAVLVALILKSFVFAIAVVPTGSMLNTIQLNDKVFASRLAYKFNDPERYDIIIFENPDFNPEINKEDKYFVKRLIGLPGETVSIVNGEVTVTTPDGQVEKLRDDFVSPENRDSYNGTFVVPENSYFFMGDNRDNSVDSRYWMSTNFIERGDLVGKVIYRLAPFDTRGKLE